MHTMREGRFYGSLPFSGEAGRDLIWDWQYFFHRQGILSLLKSSKMTILYYRSLFSTKMYFISFEGTFTVKKHDLLNHFTAIDYIFCIREHYFGLFIAQFVYMVQLQTSIIDSTLREGEQTPGVVLGIKDKFRLAESLVESGIKELEAGIPAMGDDEVAFLKSLNLFNARIICWCRSHQSDIEAALAAETGAVHISLPVSDCQLQVMGRDWHWVLEQLNYQGRFLGSRTDFPSVGAMDATRCPTDRLSEFIRVALQSGFRRIRIADTLGLGTPEKISEWSEAFSDWLPYLEFHGHNDLGMAVANTFTAVQKGFGGVSATLFGLGERAGNAPLEEILLACRISLGANLGISLEKISGLARHAASLAGEDIPERKPLLGVKINQHESGIHVAALVKDTATFTPYDPVVWGGEPLEIVWGKHSGKNALGYLLEQSAVPVEKELLNGLLQYVRKRSSELGRALSGTEILNYYKGLATPEGAA
jgi:homocitrate synthase NifV